MTHTSTAIADLIRQLTHDADEAAAEGQAWEAAACRVGALYLESLEREQALRAQAARAQVMTLLVNAGDRQPPPVRVQASSPRRPVLLH